MARQSQLVLAAALAIGLVLAGCAAEDGDVAGTTAAPVTAAAAPTDSAGVAGQSEASPAPTGESSGPVLPCADGAEHDPIVELVCKWYAEADPAVCDLMTDELLAFGWGKTGSDGRALCRTDLADAQPVKNVKVGEPRITGNTATVQLIYTPPDGEREIDRITLVRRDGEWLIDSVAIVDLVS